MLICKFILVINLHKLCYIISKGDYPRSGSEARANLKPDSSCDLGQNPDRVSPSYDLGRDSEKSKNFKYLNNLVLCIIRIMV